VGDELWGKKNSFPQRKGLGRLGRSGKSGRRRKRKARGERNVGKKESKEREEGREKKEGNTIISPQNRVEEVVLIWTP